MINQQEKYGSQKRPISKLTNAAGIIQTCHIITAVRFSKMVSSLQMKLMMTKGKLKMKSETKEINENFPHSISVRLHAEADEYESEEIKTCKVKFEPIENPKSINRRGHRDFRRERSVLIYRR